MIDTKSKSRPSSVPCMAFAVLIAASLTVGSLVVSTSAVAAATSDNTVYALGAATFAGSLSPAPKPRFVGIAGLADGTGYWLVTGSGRVYARGSAPKLGSVDPKVLNAPVKGIVATPTSNGYWVFTKKGRIFPFGDATRHGSPTSSPDAGVITAMAASPSGAGYWMVNIAGKVFGYGDASLYGSLYGAALTGFVIAIVPSLSGGGYLLATTSGTVHGFGDASFHGSLAPGEAASPIVAMARTATGDGYWLAAEGGRIFNKGGAPNLGDPYPLLPTRQLVAFTAMSVGGTGGWAVVQPRPDSYVLLGRGSSGSMVESMQRRLRSLGYWVAVDGQFGPLTEQALFAFQKYERLARTGTYTMRDRARLGDARRPVPRSTTGDLIELDVARQIIFVVRGGRTLWVFATSTGTEEPYVFEGGTYIAHTPLGHFSIYREIDGIRVSHLGKLWRPKYFSGGVAFHGSGSIPPYPASHGCSRLSFDAMDFIWENNLMARGSPVWSY